MWPSDIKRVESGCQTAFYGLILMILVAFACGVSIGLALYHGTNATKEIEITEANEAVVFPKLEATGQAQFVDFTFVLARAKRLSNEEAERIFAQFQMANPMLDCWYDMGDRGEDKVIRVHVTLPAERR